MLPAKQSYLLPYFTVFKEGDFYQSNFPESLIEHSHIHTTEADAWRWIVEVQQQNSDCKIYPLTNCAVALWTLFEEIPVNGNDEIEQDFIIFSQGTDKSDVLHWFESQFNTPIMQLKNAVLPKPIKTIGRSLMCDEPLSGSDYVLLDSYLGQTLTKIEQDQLNQYQQNVSNTLLDLVVKTIFSHHLFIELMPARYRPIIPAHQPVTDSVTSLNANESCVKGCYLYPPLI